VHHKSYHQIHVYSTRRFIDFQFISLRELRSPRTHWNNPDWRIAFIRCSFFLT
jgi:hypothetical protein